ncbi:hypothetical protein [Lutibacter sp.]|uniref:hypothetical protein n=1 Tax=Lutibacter sp. TaxID=1925666 RepID=UPI002733FB36|nr:hypothetical protein [Lutibacter sp.]MDP3314393.1 hypothetical protein [Lutibacter sp.]
MPVNLNALLRYKTLDACLRNRQIKCTIDLLIDKCSETLSESVGINIGISERTIRNDIRIMRSDILDFNAPIVFENGYYKYSNNDYSIFDRPIQEMDLLKDVQSVLVENFDTINNENIQHLIVELAKITKIKVPKKCVPEGYGIYESVEPGAIREINLYEEKLRKYINDKYRRTNKIKRYYWPFSLFKKPKLIVNKKMEKEKFNWGILLESLNKDEYKTITYN